jgi:ADP-ribosylglycohydrolase
MLGAIIGDVSGSFLEIVEIDYLKKGTIRPYEEKIKILDKKNPLFTENCSCTDDSILTCAIADAILNDQDYEKYLRLYGEREINLGKDKYGRSRFGKGFIEWLNKESEGKSFGNGAAMRVGSVGYLFNNIDDVYQQAKLATIPSHNHIDAINGATMVALSIFLARKKFSKKQIKLAIEKSFNYNLEYNLEELQRNYRFTSKCIETVLPAIYIFLISNSFEDAIRKALSIGGDSDTLACITGSIAEAYYEISDNLIKEVIPYIPEYMDSTINNFYEKINKPIKILRR